MDKFDGNTWFRFVEPAGKKLSTTIPSRGSCGTSAMSWMEEDHPNSAGQVVDRKICFRWHDHCEWSIRNIKVVGCIGHNNEMFYLYKLKKTSFCSLAYCAV